MCDGLKLSVLYVRTLDTVKLTVKLKSIVVNIDKEDIRSMSESRIQFYQILLSPPMS